MLGRIIAVREVVESMRRSSNHPVRVAMIELEGIPGYNTYRAFEAISRAVKDAREPSVVDRMLDGPREERVKKILCLTVLFRLLPVGKAAVWPDQRPVGPIVRRTDRRLLANLQGQ